MRRARIRSPRCPLADRGSISVYARNRDYHDVVKGMLKHLAQFIVSRFGPDVKVFVDTAPVMEKPLAERAGIGWQGKHTNLVSRSHGSWLFLGEIYTTLELPPDEPHADRCGSCTRCLDICPTDAFPAPYRLDATRCISYLTIEHHGPIPQELRPLMGNRIYGCDDCLAVCPWNRFAQATPHDKLRARNDLTAPRLAELAALDDAGFRTMFSGITDQAHRPRPLRAQRADRHRQQRRSASGHRRCAADRRSQPGRRRGSSLGLRSPRWSGHMSTTRTETDSLGSIEIDADRYWGPQTERARRLFQIGTDRFPPDLIRAVGLQKQAAADCEPDAW